MLSVPGLEPINYLIIGHLTKDLASNGPRLGGAAAYAARTAIAFGYQVGIVTSWGEELDSGALHGAQIINHVSVESTTFENIYSNAGRLQYLHHKAPNLEYYHIPQLWRQVPIVHLAPVAQEVSPAIVKYFRDSEVYLTPQGWLREWDDQGRITPCNWPEASFIMPHAKAAVVSKEDLNDEAYNIEVLAQSVPILAVTRGAAGASLYFEGQHLDFPAPAMEELDATGAGDIFAAVFFTQLSAHNNPIEAVRFAIQIASDSITRAGIYGAPSPEELFEIPFPEVNT